MVFTFKDLSDIKSRATLFVIRWSCWISCTWVSYVLALLNTGSISKVIYRLGSGISSYRLMENSTLESSHPLELKILFYTAFIISLPLTVFGELLCTSTVPWLFKVVKLFPFYQMRLFLVQKTSRNERGRSWLFTVALLLYW